MLSLGGIAQDKRVALNFPKHDHPILKIIKIFFLKKQDKQTSKEHKACTFITQSADFKGQEKV